MDFFIFFLLLFLFFLEKCLESVYNVVMKLFLSPYANKTVALALSGGGDSIALADYFFCHKEEFHLSLVAVNCEHGIRGEQSKKDSAFVRSFCEERNIPLYFFSRDCVRDAKEQKLSLEEAARNFRYECFSSLLKEGKADFIATAHHQNDYAETILFRLCRGTSLSGLNALSSREQFIRPMKEIPKEEILRYLEERNLPFCEDETNADETYTRNFLRKSVLPALEEKIPGTKANLCAFAEGAKEDDDFLYSLAKNYLSVENGAYRIQKCPKPLFLRAALLAMKGLGIEKDYTREHLSSLFSLWEKPTSAKISLPSGVQGIREYESISLYLPQQKSEEELPFQTGETRIGNYLLTVDALPGGQAFDKNKLPEGAVFRFRREGDYFTKFAGGTKKLKEYLCDKKIPLKERDFIPLIAKGKEIFCVIGVEISEKIKTEPGGEVWYIHIQHQGEKI